MINEQQLVDIFEEAGLEVYEGYSGRGMYGKKCSGFRSDNPIAGIINAVEVALGFLEEPEMTDFLKALKFAQMDQLGTRTIVYFPRHVAYDE